MKTSACRMNNKMNANMTNEMKKMRGEMQQIGRGLQAGMMAFACSETRTVECIMAAPHGDTMEPTGEGANCVGPAMEAGGDKLIRETCWARSVEVTEKVTVNEREKLNGVTETRTRHIETREVMNEVTELAETRRETQELKEIPETREMGTVKERLHDEDGVKDEHTHIEVVEDNGGELAERVETQCRQLVGLFGNEGR